MATFSDIFLRLANFLDDRLRRFDFWINRTAGGPSDRWLGIRRHPLPALLLPLVLAVLLAAGPTPFIGDRIVWVLTALAAALLLILGGYHVAGRWKKSLWFDLGLQLFLVTAVSAAVWLFADPSAKEADGKVYLHVLIPLVAIFAFGLVVAAPLASRMMKRFVRHKVLAEYLTETELFVHLQTPTSVNLIQLVRGLLTMPSLALILYFLLPPSIIAVSMPRHYLVIGTAVAAAGSFLGLAIAAVHGRFHAILVFFEFVFFRGSALLVSLVVILLGITRVAGVSYVATVLDGSPGTTIILYLISGYAISWWYDYWVTKLMDEEVLGLLGERIPGVSAIDYRIRPEAVHTRVPADNRLLQEHGLASFAAVRSGTDPMQPTYFHSYGRNEILSTIVEQSHTGMAKQVVDEILKQARFYSVIVTAIPAIGFFSLWLVINHGPQMSQLSARHGEAAKLVVLKRVMFDESRCRNGRPVLAVAASGGGTRAALYTTSVLFGLWRLGVIDDLRLASGVSGGGAALAYFSSHRDSLVGRDEQAWMKFFQAMREPYIQDVLNGLGEWRIMTGTRLGVLLGESFSRRWHPRRQTLGEVQDMGLILNSALAGEFVKSSVYGELSLTEAERLFRGKTTSKLAGGRLCYTNLALPTNFAGEGLGLKHDQKLPIILVQDPAVSLVQAAALNANFPPVFSNAAVDVDDEIRYWVTDGGAIDNRGMETLLYSLKDALRGSVSPGACLPPLHVIVVDASAYSDDYSQDRGLGTVTSAGKCFASQLAIEIESDIRKLYTSRGGEFWFHYLPMPDLLRRSDTFGTHWMLQKSVTIAQGDKEITLRDGEIVDLLKALHTDAEARLRGKAPVAQRWIRQEEEHRKSWERIKSALRKPSITRDVNRNRRRIGPNAINLR